jgi:hypothetical protein
MFKMQKRGKSLDSGIRETLIGLAVDTIDRSAPPAVREDLLRAHLRSAERGPLGAVFTRAMHVGIFNEIIPGLGDAVKKWLESGEPSGSLDMYLFDAGVPHDRTTALAAPYKNLTFAKVVLN